MKKLNSLTQLFEKLHDPSRTDVFCDEGKLVVNALAGYNYTMNYVINIYLHDFSGHFEKILAECLRWIRTHEPNQPIGDILEFETDIINSNDVDLAISIKVTEKVVVTVKDDDLLIDVCEV